MFTGTDFSKGFAKAKGFFAIESFLFKRVTRWAVVRLFLAAMSLFIGCGSSRQVMNSNDHLSLEQVERVYEHDLSYVVNTVKSAMEGIGLQVQTYNLATRELIGRTPENARRVRNVKTSKQQRYPDDFLGIHEATDWVVDKLKKEDDGKVQRNIRAYYSKVVCEIRPESDAAKQRIIVTPSAFVVINGYENVEKIKGDKQYTARVKPVVDGTFEKYLVQRLLGILDRRLRKK